MSFNDIKVGPKLIGGFCLLACMTLVVGLFGIKNLRSSNDANRMMYENITVPIADLQAISTAFQKVRVYITQMVISRDPKQVVLLDAQIKECSAIVSRSVEDLEKRVVDKDLVKLAEEFSATRVVYRGHLNQMSELSKAERWQEAHDLLVGAALESSNIEEAAMDKMVQAGIKKAGETAERTEKETATTIKVSIAAVAFSIAAALLIGLFLTRSITVPLLKGMEMLQEMSKGHLSTRLNMNRKDEIGTLTVTMDSFADKLKKDMVGLLNRIAEGDVSADVKVVDDKDEITPALLGMITTLRALVAEMASLTKTATDGKLDARGNVDAFKGSYRDIVAGVNSTLDAVIGPLNVAAEYVDRISKGDIPQKITAAYKGDFNEIKNNLNICIDSIKKLVEDANSVASAAVAGDMNARADASKHQGDFQKVIAGINNAIDALVGPLTRSIEHIEHLSNGVIDELITRDYNGDYNKLKVSFNRCFTTINQLVQDMESLSDDAVNGKLSTRADITKHQGDFRKIVEGVNKTLDAVVVPVNDASQTLEKMAANNFTEYMTKSYSGDHAVIKNNINKVLDTMNQSLQRVAESTNQVATTTQELSATAEQMASGSQQQTTQTAQVATSMEEMSATVQEVAKSSGVAAAKAKEAGETARVGGDVVAKTVSGMQRIASSVQELQGVIQGLSANSGKIGDIVGVIDDVADQTNLLALNAAIEAARAGEQGRGFAVVADEVRKLAERTSASTKEIAAMVKSIQEDTVKAVESMDTSAKEVSSGVSLAEQAGESLKGIVTNTKAMEEMVQQIATAAEEQSAAAEEISSNIESIASVSKQNSEGAKQTALASQELAHLTNNLQSIVDKFQLKK